MDFSLTEDQDAIRNLAAQILAAEVTAERLRELDAGAERFDERTWALLASSGMVGLSLPESAGGGGLGFLETCLVLEQVGRFTAYVPVLASAVMGGLAIAEFGDAEQVARWLPQVATGESIITAALHERGATPTAPVTTARPFRGGWSLDGEKLCVPYAGLASSVLVPATMASGDVGIFVVETSAAGVQIDALDTTSGQPEARLTFTGVEVPSHSFIGAGAAIVEWIIERTTAALCVVASGVCSEALRLTAEYTTTREQFDRPIATFQAVAQRAADAYIDAEAVRLTAWQAVWRLSEGRPAAEEVAIAKFWAAEGGQRVVHAAQHLHGGIGVDRDYPLHRYFLWAKQLELTLGGSTAQLLRLGALMADAPVNL